MIELKEQKTATVGLSKPFVRGIDGATFYPEVDAEGNLSWTNDKGLDNPETVNIKGVQGDKGDKGDIGEKGEKGDTGAAFTYEDFTEEQLAALKGDKGDTGAQGIKGDKGDTGAHFTYDMFTEEQLAALKGEQGIQGIQGEKGDKGDAFTYEDFTEEQLAALKGEKGDKGDKGADGTMTFEELTEEQKASLKGADGYTPVKGVDYWTEEDKEEILGEVGVDEAAVKKIISKSNLEPIHHLMEGAWTSYDGDDGVGLIEYIYKYGICVKLTKDVIIYPSELKECGLGNSGYYEVDRFGKKYYEAISTVYGKIEIPAESFVFIYGTITYVDELYVAESVDAIRQAICKTYTKSDIELNFMKSSEAYDTFLTEVPEEYATKDDVAAAITEEINKIAKAEEQGGY